MWIILCYRCQNKMTKVLTKALVRSHSVHELVSGSGFWNVPSGCSQFEVVGFTAVRYWKVWVRILNWTYMELRFCYSFDMYLPPGYLRVPSNMVVLFCSIGIPEKALIPLTKADQDKGRELLGRPYMQHYPEWKLQVVYILITIILGPAKSVWQFFLY